MINMAEGRAKQIVLEADARAKAIELAAEAQKAALSQYVQAGLSPAEASRLTIALRYVELLPAVLQVCGAKSKRRSSRSPLRWCSFVTRCAAGHVQGGGVSQRVRRHASHCECRQRAAGVCRLCAVCAVAA